MGSRFESVQWRVIEIDDGPIESIEAVREVSTGTIGELIVTGPMVTRQYVTRQDQNAYHKIHDGDRIWHRMGDVGYLDTQDRFWFCGRKAHRVVTSERTYFTIPIESVLNTHPDVQRCALVGVGSNGEQSPVVIVEPIDLAVASDPQRRDALIESLQSLASRNPLTRRLTRFVVRDQPLPVDIRHNSKIFREKLAAELREPSAGTR